MVAIPCGNGTFHFSFQRLPYAVYGLYIFNCRHLATCDSQGISKKTTLIAKQKRIIPNFTASKTISNEKTIPTLNPFGACSL